MRNSDNDYHMGKAQIHHPDKFSFTELIVRIELEQSMLCPSSVNADADELRRLILADMILDVCKTVVSAAHHREGGFMALVNNSATVFLASTDSRSTLSSENLRHLLGGNTYMMSRHTATLGLASDELCKLMTGGIDTIGKLSSFTREKLLMLSGMDECAVSNIELALARVCLSLNSARAEQGADGENRKIDCFAVDKTSAM